jgi:hypothetical protein
MTRLDLVKRIAGAAVRAPEVGGEVNPLSPLPGTDAVPRLDEAGAPRQAPQDVMDLFVWFEDTSERVQAGCRGIAGLPESLLPWPHADPHSLRVIERRFAEGHFHLLAGVRLRCHGKLGERIASIYTAALSVGTIAWIGTGAHHERLWDEAAL